MVSMAEEVLMMAVVVKVLVEAVAVEVESIAKNMSTPPNPRHPFSGEHSTGTCTSCGSWPSACPFVGVGWRCSAP